MLMIWGLPIFLWLLLIFWWFCSSSDEEPAQATPLAPSSTMSATSVPSSVPETPVATTGVAVKAEPSVAPSKATAIHMAGSTYDFSGARAEIPGLDLRECRSGILVDVDQHRVLWAKKANSAVPIASMTKMMTLLLVEEAIANGTVQRDAMIKVTKNAFSIGGTQVWLDPKETFPLSELMKAVAIRSANDAAYLVGEYLASGSMEAFVQSMNARAKALGMNDTYFYDPHGLGDKVKNQHNTSSAYDMILLGERLLAFPEIMKLTSTRLDSFREGKTQLRNSNNLVFNRVEGVDGLKTGYTEASGFCVTFSFKRDERRFLGCVTGFKTAKQRDAFCKKLIAWATTVH
jgi:D-alanyl-D-alanine carboxypeptidase (penicillin-binding protein 5/6)